MEPEFPPFSPAPSRRAVLKVMAASAVMAGLAGCGDGPPEEAVARVQAPEDALPGRPRAYATFVPLAGFAQPAVATVHEGRPTRLDGNPLHPVGAGSDAFLQAAVLGLYDPDRSGSARDGGQPVATARALAALADLPDPVRLVTGATTSPTLARAMETLRAERSGLRWVVHEPLDPTPTLHAATRLAFGRPVDLRWRPDRGAVTVALGVDLLGPGPHQVAHTAAWAQARRDSGGRTTLWVAEAVPTTTGAVAGARLAVAEHRLPALVLALGAAFAVAEAPGGLSDAERAWVDGAARALLQTGGAVLVAPTLAPEVQAVGLAVNAALGFGGLEMIEPVAFVADGTLADLLDDDPVAGSVVILDANPVHTAPAFARWLAQVGASAHIGTYADETAAACVLHIPLAHALETWGDGRAVDGTAVIGQPLIRPLRGGVAAVEVLAALAGHTITAQDAVRTTWAHLDDAAWRQALHDGLVPDTAARPLDLAPRAFSVAPSAPVWDGLEVVLHPDPRTWDGRFANNAWLRELPTPRDKISWDFVAALSPALAATLGVHSGDRIEITAPHGAAVEAVAWVVEGQAPQTIALSCGGGRRIGGRLLAEGEDYAAFALAPAPGVVRLDGVTVRPTGGRRVEVCRTQRHFDPGGRDLMPAVAPGGALAQPDGLPPSIYPPWSYAGERAWGMVIDTDLCTGCNACVVACQSENNVPVVGREEVRRGREMHWLRVDRYTRANGDTRFLPVPCMHCEKAPCELGCPVNATVHGPEGLNQMVYNRCIGTRTCSSYCPYKVRRFNWFSYSDGAPEDGRRAQRNPDVTVRGRGVIEKCTYCVQRITRARQTAALDGTPIADGTVTTACQDACPSRAIVFGDLNDAASAVNRGRLDGRNFRLLEEVNTWPRTTYLAAIREG